MLREPPAGGQHLEQLTSLPSWLEGFKTGFRDKLAAAFDDTGIQWLASWPGAAQAMAEWHGGQACVCFVCWDENGGCYAVLVPRQGDGVTPPWSPKGEE